VRSPTQKCSRRGSSSSRYRPVGPSSRARAPEHSHRLARNPPVRAHGKTPQGTSVGVDDPYEFAGVCDHLTGDGKCRYAFDHYTSTTPSSLASARMRSTSVLSSTPNRTGRGPTARTFARATATASAFAAGSREKRIAHDDERPLLEEHHLSYERDGETLSHEITIYLCRWCHSKVHNSWARITDDAGLDPAAIAALEERRSREQSELGFESAAERYDDER